MGYVLSIDQSTSGTKGLVWNTQGRLCARADLPHRQITNEKGWVEHDPLEILNNTLEAARLSLAKAGIAAADIVAVGISNQRETAVCWDSSTGQPLCGAIVWQCARAVDVTERVEAKGMADTIYKITGLPLSPFFSAAKFGWMLQHVPAVQAAFKQGTLCCGTMDAWLVFRLTGGKSFKTDYSNASRTQLLDLDTLQWSEEAAGAFGLNTRCLPEITFSDGLFGHTTFGGLFPAPVPIHGVMGDSHAALLGNRCTRQGMAKATYGTGSSIMMNAGKRRPSQSGGVVTSLAWGMGGVVEYVLEGNINYAGAITKWLVEDLELLDSAEDAGVIAAMAGSTGGVYLVPAFSGLGAPYFDNRVRAAIVGMSRMTKKAHIVRAAEECIAYQITDVVTALNAACASPLRELHVDGGPTNDAFLMQFQADMLGMPLKISQTEELSGAGAAYCAMLGAKLADPEVVFSNTSHKPVRPQMDDAERQRLYTGWRHAVTGIANMKS